MSNRKTERQAFDAITASGYSSKISDLVVELLARSPAGRTGAEVNAGVKAGANRRLSELEQAGLVHRDGIRKCTVTGLSAIVWKYGRGR